MTDAMEVFKKIQKAVGELDRIDLKNSTKKRNVELQLTEIASLLPRIRALVSEDIYKEWFLYVAEILEWMRYSSDHEFYAAKSQIQALRTYLQNIKPKLLGQLEEKKDLTCIKQHIYSPW